MPVTVIVYSPLGVPGLGLRGLLPPHAAWHIKPAPRIPPINTPTGFFLLTRPRPMPKNAARGCVRTKELGGKHGREIILGGAGTEADGERVRWQRRASSPRAAAPLSPREAVMVAAAGATRGHSTAPLCQPMRCYAPGRQRKLPSARPESRQHSRLGDAVEHGTSSLHLFFNLQNLIGGYVA